MTELAKVIDKPKRFRRFGAVVLLETVEHVPLAEVSDIEAGVFGYIEPDVVVITTPDATKRLNEEQLAARGHHFEWDVAEFRDWTSDVVTSYPDYGVSVSQLDGPSFVRNTQVAVFSHGRASA